MFIPSVSNRFSINKKLHFSLGATLPEVAIALLILIVLMTIGLKGFVVTGESKLDDLEKSLLLDVYNEATGSLEIDSIFVPPIKTTEIPDELNASCGLYPGFISENPNQPKIVYCINDFLLQKPVSFFDPGLLISSKEVNPRRIDGFNICSLLIDAEESKSFPLINGVPFAFSFRLSNSNYSNSDNYIAVGNGELLVNFNCVGKMSEIAGYVKGVNAIKDIVKLHEINITKELLAQQTVKDDWFEKKANILRFSLESANKILSITKTILSTVESTSQIIEAFANKNPVSTFTLLTVVTNLAVSLPRTIWFLNEDLIFVESLVSSLPNEPGELATAQKAVDLAKENFDKSMATKKSYLNYIESLHNKGVWQ